VMWAASGSEAVQKALWACLHRDEQRDMIVATLAKNEGEIGAAARELQVSRTTMWRLMKKHNLG